MSEAVLFQDEALKGAIVQLLNTIPEVWTERERASITEAKEQARALLTCAGMREKQTTLRIRMVGHPTAVEATIRITGKSEFSRPCGLC